MWVINKIWHSAIHITRSNHWLWFNQDVFIYLFQASMVNLDSQVSVALLDQIQLIAYLEQKETLVFLELKGFKVRSVWSTIQIL